MTLQAAEVAEPPHRHARRWCRGPCSACGRSRTMPAGRPEAESVEAWRRGQGPRALDGRNLARKGQSRAGHGMDQSVVASLSCSSLVLGKVLLSRRCGERKVAFHARKKAASRVLSRLDTITAMTATQACEKAGSSCSGIRAWASTPGESARQG